MTSLAPVDPQELRLRERTKILCGEPIVEMTPVTGGGNNRVYRVQCRENVYALKLYPSFEGDGRDRLGAEFTALSFLREHGVGSVPAAVATARYADGDIGLYEWIKGSPISDPSDADLNAALELVRCLSAIRSAKSAKAIGPAAEASFSGAELVRQLASRLSRLETVAEEHADLKNLLSKKITPKTKAWVGEARRAYVEQAWDFDDDLGPVHRTLSPSDFGFHNALRSATDGIVFLDFEYFGWDDPVRLVADFLLHPSMEISEDGRAQFVREARTIFADDLGFNRRLNILYPLIGLRWCLILLNEFLPERWARRAFAGAEDNLHTALHRQLQKAARLLDRLGDRKGGRLVAG